MLDPYIGVITVHLRLLNMLDPHTIVVATL